MNRKTAVLVAIVLLALTSGIFLFAVKKQPPTTIGFVAGLSGKFADLGIDCRRGVEMAVARINDMGGVHGRRINVIIKDDNQNEQVASAAVEELLAAEVPVIIGHATSSMTMTTLPMVNASSTLMVSPTTSTPLLENIDDNFVRTCAVSTAAAAMMARYLYEVEKIPSVGIIYDLGNKAYTEKWVENFSKTFLAKGNLRIETLTFTSQPDLEMLPLVKQMFERQVEALVFVANSVDAAMLCQQVRKMGWQVPIALSDWAATEQLINLGGNAVEGAVISQFFNRKSQNPAYLEFKASFVRQYKSEPGFGALHAYNAANMVFRAMSEQQGNETIKEAILRISRFDGLQDDIVINQYGDSNHPTYMGIVRNGEFMIIEDYQ